jgi:hypothetical protein
MRRRSRPLLIPALLLTGLLIAACGGNGAPGELTQPTVDPRGATQTAFAVIAAAADPVCPAGAVIRDHFPQAHAQYRYLEGLAALAFFETQVFNPLKDRICWQGGAHQFVFRANLEGAAHFYSFDDSFEKVSGGVSVLSAGCLSSSGNPGTFMPAAEVTILGGGLEMLAISMEKTEMYLVRNAPDGTKVDVKTFTPADSACR